jgi:peroxiredoxin
MLHDRYPMIRALFSVSAFWLLVTLATSCTWAQSRNTITPQSRTTEIVVKLSDYPHDTVMLAYYLGNKQYIKDTFRVVNNTVTMRYPEGLANGIYLFVLKPDNRYFEFIVAGEPRISFSCKYPDYIESMRIENSEENRIFYDYLRFSAQRGKLADSLNKQVQALTAAGDTAKARLRKEELQAVSREINEYREKLQREKPNAFLSRLFQLMQDPVLPETKPADYAYLPDSAWKYYWFRNHYIPDFAFQSADFLRTPVFHERLMKFFEKVIPQHWDSLAYHAVRFVSRTQRDTALFQYCLVTLTNKYGQSNIMCQEAIYVALVDSFYCTGKAKWTPDSTVRKMCERADRLRPICCGRAAPDLTLWDWNARPIPLNSLEHEYTILYFYDPNCGHCKKTSPKLAAVHAKYADYNVGFYAVVTAGNDTSWKKFVQQHGMGGPNVYNVGDIYGTSNVKTKFDILATPVMFILDQNKRIIAKRLSPSQVDQFLARVFGLPLPAIDPTEEAMPSNDNTH